MFFGCGTKTRLVLIGIFFKIDLCSAIPFKRFRRGLSIDVAEHRSILKNYQNTYNPRFSFTPKTGIAFPKTGVLFLLCRGFRYTVHANVHCLSDEFTIF